MQQRAWSKSYQSISVLDSSARIKVHALIAGISEDRGLEHFLIRFKSIKNEEFVQFLEELSKKYKGQPLTLFMDNLQVHKT
jgi:hypothetical protein